MCTVSIYLYYNLAFASADTYLIPVMGPDWTGFEILGQLNGDIADDVQTKGRNCSVALQFEPEQNFLIRHSLLLWLVDAR